MSAAADIDRKMATAERLTGSAEEKILAIGIPSQQIGYQQIGVSPGAFGARYTPAARDTTPMPSYKGPVAPRPVAPTLVALHGINVPYIPDPPGVATGDLFRNQKPSGNLPEFQQSAPSLSGDRIAAKIEALAQPVFKAVAVPDISPISIRPIPKALLPGYDASPPPADLQAPEDYARYYQEQFGQAYPAFQGMVNGYVEAAIQRHAPEYEGLRTKLGAAIDKMLGGGILPDGLQGAMESRLVDSIRADQASAERGIINDPTYAGWVQMPGEQRGNLGNALLDAMRAKAASRTDAHINVMNQQVAIYQFAVGVADGQMAALRGMVMQFFGIAFQGVELAMKHAFQKADLRRQIWQDMLALGDWWLGRMRALDERFKLQLEIAMGDLSIYKEELEALKALKDVELKALDAAKLKLESQEIEVRFYSALVDAIAKQAVGDEIKIKQFGLYVDLFKAQTEAKLAEFDVFKAQNEGDKSLLEGRMAALSVHQERLKGIELQIQAQTSVLKGDVALNDARLGVYQAQESAFESSVRAALQEFTAKASLKELGMNIYKVDSDINLEIFKSEQLADKYFQDARLEAFRGNAQSFMEYLRLTKGYTDLKVSTQENIAHLMSTLASATSASANTSVSLAE